MFNQTNKLESEEGPNIQLWNQLTKWVSIRIRVNTKFIKDLGKQAVAQN